MRDEFCARGWEEAGEPLPLDDLLALREAVRPHLGPPAPDAPPELFKPVEHGHCLREALAEGLGWVPGHPEYDALAPGLTLADASALLDRLGIPYVTDGHVTVHLGVPYVFLYREAEGPQGGHAVFTRQGPRFLDYIHAAGKELWLIATLPERDDGVERFRVTSGDLAGVVGEMVGRFCDPSYNDIELLFPDGQRRWFRMREVEPAVSWHDERRSA